MGKRNRKRQLLQTASVSQAQRHIAGLGLTDRHAYEKWCREQGLEASVWKTWRRRKQEKRLAAKLAAEADRENVLLCHLRDLKLETAEEYAFWCRAQGFSESRHKSAASRKREVRTIERERAAKTLQNAVPDKNAIETWAQAIAEGRVAQGELPTPLLQHLRMIWEQERNPSVRQAMRELIDTLAKRSRILKAEDGLRCLGAAWGNTYMQALYGLAQEHRRWIRPLPGWKPKGQGARQQFANLARYLLTEYDVPAFMDRAWFEGETPLAQAHRAWFIQVGNGMNLRMLDLPFPLTKLAAHHALKAPADFSFEAAFRWGQARGLGGSESQARAIAASQLKDIQCEEAFWETVIHWFVNHPELAVRHVGPIVDFIFNVKFEPRDVAGADGAVETLPPREADFTMKGRTPAALLRRVEEWHQELAVSAGRPARAWESLGVSGFEARLPDAAQEAELLWTIRELCSSRELEAEGRAMNNCVASYIDSCVEGKSSIWSLRLVTPDRPDARRVMTIEIDPETKTIVQARGKCNLLPSDKPCPNRLKTAPHLLRRWAAQQGLRLDADAW